MDAADDSRPMGSVRRFLLLGAVIGCLVLAVLSVIPTFLGPDAAKRWFLSPLGAAAWGIFAFLTAAGIVAIGALRRRPGLLAMHVGMVLVIAGAMWGSELMRRLRSDLFGSDRITEGQMIIYQGESSSEVFDQVRAQIDRLPFEVHLEKFWIEYYDVAPEDPWEFTIWTIDRGSEGAMPQWIGQRVAWRQGKPIELSSCDVELLVTDYQLAQYGEGPDAPVLPEVKVRLSRGGAAIEGLLQPQPGKPELRLSLAALYGSEEAWHEADAPWLRFQRPTPVIKDFKSALIVRDGDRELARKTIEVNAPLHVGGYHFYQSSYDQDDEQYTVLSVVSDAGLSTVYAGFILLIGGLVWHALSFRRPRRTRGGDVR